MRRVKDLIDKYRYELLFSAPLLTFAALLAPRSADLLMHYHLSRFSAAFGMGLVRRVLPGALVSLLPGEISVSRVIRVCLIFAIAAAIVTALLMGRAARRFEDKLDFSIFAAMFYACPLFITRLFCQEVYFGCDAVALLLTFLAVSVIRRAGSVFALCVTISAAMLTDERFAFAYFPAVLAVAWLEVSPGAEKKRAQPPNVRKKLLLRVKVSSALTAVCFLWLGIVNPAPRGISPDGTLFISSEYLADIYFTSILEPFREATASSALYFLLNILLSLAVISPLILTLALFWRTALKLGIITRGQARSMGLLPLCAVPLFLLDFGCMRSLFAAVMTQFICSGCLILTRKSAPDAVRAAVGFWRKRPFLLVMAVALESVFLLFTFMSASLTLRRFLQSFFLFF